METVEMKCLRNYYHSKFFYSFTFYFLLFRITFYFFFSELLFTFYFFLYLCPIPSVYSNQQSHRCHHC